MAVLRSVILSRYTLYAAYTHDTIQPYTWTQTGRFQLCGAQPIVNCSCSQHNRTENNVQKHKLNELYSWTETAKLHYILIFIQKILLDTKCQTALCMLYSNDLPGHKVSICTMLYSNDLAGHRVSICTMLYSNDIAGHKVSHCTIFYSQYFCCCC